LRRYSAKTPHCIASRDINRFPTYDRTSKNK
jgi:hypothetical protein